jgi:S1-C subfamily serine protease
VNQLDIGALVLLLAGIVLGVRSGALPQVGGLIGAAAGAYLGLIAIPAVLPHLDAASVPLRVAAVLGLLLVAVGLGEMIGSRGGRAVSRLLGNGLLGALDRVAGGIVGAGQAVLIVWLVGGILATGLLPSVARQAQTSVAMRGLAAVLPPPTALVLELGKVFDESGLPDVFLGLERLPADPVGLPTDAIASALGQAALASVPRVEALACDYRSTGTGVVIRGSYVVTNAHVVAGSRSIRVVTGSGALDAVPVFMDPDLDVALLYVPGLRAVPLRFATLVPDRGSLGATVGYPNGGHVVIEPAAVTATYVAEGLDITGKQKVRRQIVELRATVQPGDSGGPLLLADGTVGGLVFAESKTDPQVGYALTPTAVAVDVGPALGRTAAASTGACLH